MRQRLAQSVVDQEQAAADEARLTAELEARQVRAGQTRALADRGRHRSSPGRPRRLLAGPAAAGPRAARCGITWWALAGIRRVESNHGTYGLSLARADGEHLDPIIGIPLDGTRGTRLITDTDGGLLDGDTSYDRAVGPMQFIP